MSYEFNAYTLGNNMEVFHKDSGNITAVGASTQYLTCSVLPANRGDFQVEEVIIYTVTYSAAVSVYLGYKHPNNTSLTTYNNIVGSTTGDMLPVTNGAVLRFSRNTGFIEGNTVMKWCVPPGLPIIAQNTFGSAGTVRYKIWIKGRYY